MPGKEGIEEMAGTRETQQTQRSFFASQENCRNVPVPVQKPVDHCTCCFAAAGFLPSQHASTCHPLPPAARCWHWLQVLAALLVLPFQTRETPGISHLIGLPPHQVLERPCNINHTGTGTSVACERYERDCLCQGLGRHLSTLDTNCFQVPGGRFYWNSKCCLSTSLRQY